MQTKTLSWTPPFRQFKPRIAFIEWVICIAFPPQRANTWLRVTKKEEDRIYKMGIKLVVTIWVAAALAGMLFTYRLGEYIQTKRMIDNGWHLVIPVSQNG